MSDLQTEVAKMKAILRAKKGKMEDENNQKGLQALAALEQDRLPPELALVLQGASLNFSDEIGAVLGQGDFDAVADTLNEGQAKIAKRDNRVPPEEVSGYDINLSQIRQPINEFRQEKPFQAMGYETLGAGGAALATGGATNLIRGGQTLGRMASAVPSISRAKQAGIGGVVAGVGGGETAEERLIGGGVGGVGGFGVQKILDMASTPVKNLTQRLQSNRKVTKEGRNQARRLLKDAIESDLTTPEEAITYVANMQGKDVTLADIGSNTRVLIDALATLPGPAKERASRYLRQRMEGRPARLTGILQEAFGSKSRFYDDFAALKSARGKSADILYGQANKVNIPMNDNLRAFFQSDAAQEAYQRALRIARNEDAGSGMDKFRIAESGDILGPDGVKVSEINTRFLHFMKMGMDDLAFPKIPSQGIGAAETQSIRNVRNDFISEIDSANPIYARARSLYAGDSRMMDSLKRGREFLNADPDELAAEIATYSKSEKEAFRLGSMHALQDQLERSPETANVAQNMLKSPKRKMLLRQTFDGPDAEDNYQGFMANLGREADMARVEQAGMNSATAQRQEVIGLLKSESAMPGVPTSLQDLLATGLRDEGLNLQENRLRATADELARMLTETDPAALQKILRELQGGRSLKDVLSGALPSEVIATLYNTATSPMVVGNLVGSLPAYVPEAGPNMLNSAQELLQERQQQ